MSKPPQYSALRATPPERILCQTEYEMALMGVYLKSDAAERLAA